MKRKFVAVVLVLAMIMGVNTIAMAVNKLTDTGDAGIAYVEGKIIIIDPGEPEIPGGKDWEFVTNRDIDFGEHDLGDNITEQRYASWIEHRGTDTDYVGIVINNGSLDELAVNVQISQFYIVDEDIDDLTDGTPTLLGFELDLVTQKKFTAIDAAAAAAANEGKDDDDEMVVANISNNKPANALSQPDKAIANSTNKEFDPDADHKPGKINATSSAATVLELPGLGVSAAAWGGVLTVPQNTVEDLGEAQAIMTWTILRGPLD